MFRGWWTPFQWRGVALRLHWSLPLVAFLVGTGYLARGLAFVFLFAAHELGHAILVRRFGGTVVAVELSGVVGFCRWQGKVSRHEATLIAWGGILAQFAVLAAALFVLRLFPDVHRIQETKVVLVDLNIGMMFLNLVPMHPLDGALAWYALPGMFRGRRRAAPKSRIRADHLRVVESDDEEPPPPSIH